MKKTQNKETKIYKELEGGGREKEMDAWRERSRL